MRCCSFAEKLLRARRLAAVAAMLILFAAGPAFAVDQFVWQRDDLIVSAHSLAAHVDIRDRVALERALGVEVQVRPYCGNVSCAGRVVLGVVRAAPDPPLRLPGEAGMTAQYYMPERMDPPGSDLTLVGTLATLDLFPSRDAVCLRRSGVREALGDAAFQGSSLGRGEPLEVALNYVAFTGAEYRTVVEFVFTGPPSEDGCLAYASIHEDNFDVGGEVASRRAAFQPLSWKAGNSVYFDEDRLDHSAPPEVLDPSSDRSPLGLSRSDFAYRFPECSIGESSPVDTVSPLTDLPPPMNELLPTFEQTYLATSHSLRETYLHGRGQMPAVDASLLATANVECRAVGPLRTKYSVLEYDDQIAALLANPYPRHNRFVPAGIEAAEAIAQTSAASAQFTAINDPFATVRGGKAQDQRSVVFATSADRRLGIIVAAGGPLQLDLDRFLMWSRVQYAFVDMRLWAAYSNRVQEKLQVLRKGMPAGFAEACTFGKCEPAPIGAGTGTKPAAPLLQLIRTIVAAGDLENYQSFEDAIGSRVIALERRPGRMIDVGLAPGPSALEGIGFRYSLIPDDVPLQDVGRGPKLSSYHRKIAEIDLGSYELGAVSCVTADDLVATFGPNQNKEGRGQKSQTFVYRFDQTRTAGDRIYVTFSFSELHLGRSLADLVCAQKATISQYRLIQPP